MGPLNLIHITARNFGDLGQAGVPGFLRTTGVIYLCPVSRYHDLAPTQSPKDSNVYGAPVNHSSDPSDSGTAGMPGTPDTPSSPVDS